MDQSSFPLIKEITIDSLANNCRYEFGIKKAILNILFSMEQDG